MTNLFGQKLPQTTLRVSSLLRSIFPNTLDKDTFAITETRPSDVFLRSTLVLSQQSQSDNLKTPFHLLTPSTLRTAAIVDRTANLASAATDLIMSRFAFNGSSPYAPDVILVNELCVQPFIELLVKEAPRYLNRGSQQARKAPRRENNPRFLEQIASEVSCRIIVSGTGWAVALVDDR